MSVAKSAEEYSELINQIFDNLKVIMIMPAIDKSRRGIGRKALCECICGNYISPQIISLRNLRTKSCGCIGNRSYNKLRRPKPMHGYRNHYLYNTWCNIKTRCLNKNNRNYEWYGARGITVYKDWLEDPTAFIKYIEKELGERPIGKSLDRIDNNGNYEPRNLRWATQKEQIQNSRICE